MKVVCAPNPIAVQAKADLFFAMMQAPTRGSHGRVALQFRELVRRAGVVPNSLEWDFATLALAAVAADYGCLRKASPDGWTREIDLHVALQKPAVWAPHVDSFASALQFLTGDLWKITLYEGGLPPLPRTPRVRRPPITGDCVSLLSGGVDSLVGAINLASMGRVPVLVSQVAKGDAVRQVAFVRAIKPSLRHVQLSHTVQVHGPAERSQRARSIVFLAFGALAASSLRGSCDEAILFVPENGFISYNVPLTPLRIGSLSTRTTHPHFIRQIQSLWNAVGMEIRIENPYQHNTKGEMLANCANQSLLRSLVFDSTSCGRFGRFGYKHCGRCVPCLVRRAAFLAWGNGDSTKYVYENLGAESGFDDVRSVALACLKVDAEGTLRWSRNALSSQYVDNVSAAVELVERGLHELRKLLHDAGVL